MLTNFHEFFVFLILMDLFAKFLYLIEWKTRRTWKLGFRIWTFSWRHTTIFEKIEKDLLGACPQFFQITVLIGLVITQNSFCLFCVLVYSPHHIVKITQNVAHEFLNFGIFHQFLSYFKIKLTCLVTLFDRKLLVFKTRQYAPFLPFLIKFCPLKL